MQIRKSHRMIAAVLAFVLVLGLAPTAVFARSVGNDGSAAMNEIYESRESLMPIGPSFNIDTLLEWTPESDPDARYSRASIRLADRVGGFVVNPLVNPEAKLMLCSLANSDHDNTSAQGTESFLSYSFNYWQYAGSFVYWSGSEEGLICCPTGEFTDAAHTNGVPVVATLGFPWGSGSGYVEQVRAFLQKDEDGSFPVADKLIEVMDYYGFDGYFFNQESYGCSAADGQLIDEMMRYMHTKRPDMLISWYDSMLPTGGVSYQNAVNDYNKQFMTDSADGTRAIDEFMMNYNWYDSQVNTTISTMKSVGRSQFDAFAGIDVQQNCMDTAFRDYLLVDEDGMTRLSLALYCPNSTLGLSTSGENFHEVEQTFYTNEKGDPRDTSVNLNTNDWAGMSRFFADHTVILKAPFVTDFNAGHGRGYYVDGELSRDAEWSYQSVQDVLPTWTWIIDSGGEKLSGGYDFTTAYNGGNSIKFAGSLSAGKANDIMLYSTKVAVENGMKLALTYKGDQGKMKLVAYYGDASTTSYGACEKVAYDLTASTGDWTTTTVDISASAGKTLYAIGLKMESAEDVENYQVNLGRLSITEKERPTLSGPTTVTLDEILYTDAYTAEARIYWTPVVGAASYEIFKDNRDGTRTLIMETPNTAFYIPTLSRDADETDVALVIHPVNRNGQRGDGTQLIIDWAYGNQDSDKIEKIDFENVCLNAPVTGVSFENSGEPASKALDGTSANNSKWCATNMGSGWMSIDIGRDVTVRRWRVEHAEYGGEANNMNTIDFALEYKDAGGNWVEVKRIRNNTLAVTDVLLDEPVTAREWRLYVYDDGSSPWGGIRIYEWQMFETDQFPMTDAVPMHFAAAENNMGAADTFTLRNVPVGQTVKVYTKSDETYDLIGEATAVSGTVTLENLDFGTTGAGKVYYTTTSNAAAESAKLSAPFEAEYAEKSAAAEDVSFVKFSQDGSVSSSLGADIYTTMTVSGLGDGDVIYVYENGADGGATKTSLPAVNGSVSISRVLVTRAGGPLSLQVKRTGKLISDIYTVNTPAFDEPTATINVFARNQAGESLTGVHFSVQNAAGKEVTQIHTTSDSGGKAAVPLGAYTLKCLEVPQGYGLAADDSVILRIEGWNYDLEVTVPESTGPVNPPAPVLYKVEISGDMEGGTVTADKTEAEAGQTVTLTVTAHEGYDYVEGSLMVNGTAIAGMTFEMPAEDVVITARFEKKAQGGDEDAAALLEAAQAAQAAAEEAQRLAEEAAAAAEAAQKAAEEAAASAAADKEAAQKAAQKAAAAQAEAEAAQAAAQEARKAAEEAAAAAEASNLEAAEEARKAAEEAAAAAKSAADAADYAAQAAQAQQGAQAAQEAAEAAQTAAEEARKKAQEAQEAAEEAAASAAEDREAAERAQAEAEAAWAAAEEAQKAAEDAAAAAEAARDAAAEHDTAAAAAAAEAARYAQEVARQYEEITAMKAEMAQYLLDAQKAAEEAEEARKAAEAAELASAKYYALYVLSTYADKDDYSQAKQEKLEAILDAATEAIANAGTVEEVESVLAAAKAQIDALGFVLPYTDVAENAWYYDAVTFVYQKGLFKGTTDTTFAPEATMDRAMMVTVLYRLAGEPEVSGSTTFTDVNTGAYYYNALLWAGENGIVTGIDETTFAPFASVTREQMVTFLYRYAQYAGADVTAAADLTGFADRDQLGNYAKAPMAWAVAEGIIYGVTDTTLAPKATATRAQVAAILMRLVEG